MANYVSTVGELREAIARLPDDTKITGEMGWEMARTDKGIELDWDTDNSGAIHIKGQL